MANPHHLLSGDHPHVAAATTTSHRKKLLLALSTLLLLLVVATTAIAITATHHHPTATSPSHALLRSSCSSTLYPDLCFSAIASAPSLLPSLSDHKSVILSSLNLTSSAVHHAFYKFLHLFQDPSHTPRERGALHDCLEVFDDTLDELRKAQADLRSYPGGGKSLTQHASDLKTLLSAAMSNQESCLDGFSHDAVCRRLRASVQEGVTHVSRMCSNSLAMIRNLTDGDIAAEAAGAGGRRLLGDGDDEAFRVDGGGFPEWMPTGDRRLLQAAEVAPDVVVAADGSGDFETVSAAVAAAPEKSKKRYVIRIKAGVYKENVNVPKKKTNIMFVGDGRGKTVITGSRNVIDGSTTFHSATVAVVGERFLARDLTVENTAGPSKHQAVALRVGADLSAFYRCDILAYQDTLYVHSLRQFFRECLVRGTVDFIFGNAAAVLQGCELQARRPNPGQRNMFTAQGREDPNQNTGISIHSCTLSAAPDLAPVQASFKSFLGRPWKAYSRTVVMKSEISDVIDPAGWHEWAGTFGQSTCYYAEYMNTGAGAGTARRVKWKGVKVIASAAEAAQFAPGNFVSGASWLGSTGFPFSLGL